MGLEMMVILEMTISFLHFYFQHSLKCIVVTPSWSGNRSARFNICYITNLQSCIYIPIHICRWSLFNCALAIESFDCNFEALTATHRFLLHKCFLCPEVPSDFFHKGKFAQAKCWWLWFLSINCCQCVWRVNRNVWNTILWMYVHTNMEKRAFSQ